MRYVVKHADGTYWDLGLFRNDLWLERQRDACKFTQRARAEDVAARTGAKVVRLVSPERSTER